MSKKIYITESQARRLKLMESVMMNPDKTRVVADFLNNTFMKGVVPTIDDNGYPSKLSIVAMKGFDGKPIRYMNDKQLFYLLQDKFRHIMSNENERDEFLKHVMVDWYEGKIGKYGLTSKNHLNEGWFKNAAVGAMMGASVLGGMQSCSGPINAPTTQVTKQHQDYPDCSDRPWAFQEYIGQTMEAYILVIEDKYRIKQLAISNLPNATYHADFQDCSWGIFFDRTEKRDNYFVDIFHSHGAPLIYKDYEGQYLDGECYFELWYTNDESLSMEERAVELRVYRRDGDRRQTTWNISIDRIKETNHFDINYNGPNNRNNTTNESVLNEDVEKLPEDKQNIPITYLTAPNRQMIMLYKRPHAINRMSTRHVTDQQLTENVKLALEDIMKLIKQKRILINKNIIGALSGKNVVNIVNRSNLVFLSCYVFYQSRDCLGITVLTTFYDDGKIDPEFARLNEKTPDPVARLEVGEAGEEWAYRRWVLDNYGSDPEIGGKYAKYVSKKKKKKGDNVKNNNAKPENKDDKPAKLTPSEWRDMSIDRTWQDYDKIRRKLSAEDRKNMEKEYQDYLNYLESMREED